jgi:hypothetical protein
MTVLTMIESCLTLLNVNAVGDALSDAEAQDILQTLNMMMDQWKTEQFLLYMIKDINFAVTANTQTYTIGPGGTWDTTTDDRPERIENAFCRTSGGGTLNIDFVMRQMTHKTFQDLPLKGFGTSYPTHYMYVPDYPLGVISLYPVPAQALRCYLGVWMQFASFTGLTQTIRLPPGYLQTIRYNLAAELIPQYGTPPEVGALIIKRAEEHKNQLRTINNEPRMMKFDSALTAGSGRFCIWTGWPSP